MGGVDDPFAVLGLTPAATLADVRAARRQLALVLHPDRGGDEVRMREVNLAFDLAVKAILRPAPLRPAERAPAPAGPSPESPVARRRRSQPGRTGLRVEHDSPSFSIELLPAKAFEALLIVVAWIGEVLVDDPPYLLDAHLDEPSECWCRMELLPEAGSSTVSLTVAGVDGGLAPPVDDVRDLLVASLNALGTP